MLRERPRMDYADYEMKLKAKKKNAEGHEVPDPVPMAPPVGYQEFPSMIETVQKMVRDYHLQRELAAQGHETFEEADDFDIDEDPAPRSEYEDDEDLRVPDFAASSPTGGSPPGQGGEGAGSAKGIEKQGEDAAATASPPGGGEPTVPPSTSPSVKK